jgi:hypothetical protein
MKMFNNIKRKLRSNYKINNLINKLTLKNFILYLTLVYKLKNIFNRDIFYF